MLLGQAALCKEASKLESKELRESKFHHAFMSELEDLLLDVYNSLLPTASEYEQRKKLIHAYNMVAKSTFGNIGGFPVVEAFGSFTMNMFTAKSDLDLSINFNNSRAVCLPRDQAVSVLRRFSKVLYKEQRKGHLSGVLPILHARVPVLKAVDCMTGIECDISIENKDGISRSLFFSIISSVDERFRIMSYLMKAWAKANDINSSKDRTMNSLSIISLAAFHFQTRDPPILPPFSTLFGDGTDITNVRNAVLEFKNFGGRNKESVAELFVSLLSKLSSVEKLWELGLCASTFEGSWISKTWGSKVGNMSVEDFLDRSQNFARSVGKFEMSKIYDILRGSLKHLSRYMQGEIEISALRSVLFGSISFDARINHVNNNTWMTLKRKLPSNEPVEPPVLPQFLNQLYQQPQWNQTKPSKRARYTEATGASDFGSHENQNIHYFPNPVRYPVPPYVPGYLSHRDRDPKPPIAAYMGHGSHHPIQPPFTNQSVYASQYRSTGHHPVQHVYGSEGLQYDGRHPSILPGYMRVPPRSFGSNHH